MKPLGPLVPWILRLWLVGLAAVAGAWALASLFWPFGPDQGCFAYVGDAIVRGGMPYRDAWDFKGPLVYAVFGVLQAVFGRQMWAIRLLDIVLLAAAAFAATSIVSRFASRFAAGGTALLMVLAFANFGSWYTAQPDGWAALGLVIVAALLLRAPGQPSARDVAVAALVLGCCALLKPLYAVFLLLVLVAIWPPRGERRALIRPLLVASATFAAPIAVMLVWLTARGDLGDAFDVHVRFNFERIRTDPYLRMSTLHTLQATLGVLTGSPILALATPAAALGAGTLWQERRRAGVLMVLWVGLSLVLIASQKKFLVQNYSWHPLYPPLGLLAGIGLARLWGAGAGDLRPGRWLVVVGALALAKMATHDPLVQIGRWTRYVRGSVTLAEYQSGFEVDVPALGGGSATDFGFSVPRDVELARYFQAHSRPTDQVFVWNDPFVGYLADRPTIEPVNLAAAFNVFGTDERRSRYRADLLSRMRGEHAAYFGAAKKDLTPGPGVYDIQSRFPELAELLAAEYEESDVVGDVQLFRHRKQGGGTGSGP